MQQEKTMTTKQQMQDHIPDLAMWWLMPRSLGVGDLAKKLGMTTEEFKDACFDPNATEEHVKLVFDFLCKS